MDHGVASELLAGAGSDHGAETGGEGDEVEDGADHGHGLVERHDGVGAALGAPVALHFNFSHILKFYLTFILIERSIEISTNSNKCDRL